MKRISLIVIILSFCFNSLITKWKVWGDNVCPFPCLCRGNTLYCNNEELIDIPMNIPQETRELILKDNYIKKIKSAKLNYLFKTISINFRSNFLTYVEPKAFQSLKGLKDLTLRENRIKYLDPKVFEGLQNLETLSLRSNKLTNVEEILYGLYKLRFLSLGDNKIQHLTKNTFRSNSKLFVLDMHNNSLTHIHKSSFKSLTYLKYLVIRDNPLTQVDLNFKLNYHLELIDFTNCKLKNVVKGLPLSIRDLRISENRIKELKRCDFKKTRKIRFLQLNNNKIQKIANDTFFGFSMLYDLHISNNSLKYIPEYLPNTLHGFFAVNNSIHSLGNTTFRKNKHLEMIGLNHNELDIMDKDALESLEKLRYLDLSKNKLKILESEHFKNTPNLELLDMSDNPLDEADKNCFYGLKKLHILQMSNMGKSAKVRPSIFEGTKHLLYLDISNSTNLAKSFVESPFLLENIKTVEDLNLKGDEIHTLPSNFPDFFPNLKKIRLTENPWHCDQSLYWLTKWIHTQRVTFHGEDEMKCASPPELEGRRLGSLILFELLAIVDLSSGQEPIEVDVLNVSFILSSNFSILTNDTFEYGSGSGSGEGSGETKLENKTITINKNKTKDVVTAFDLIGNSLFKDRDIKISVPSETQPFTHKNTPLYLHESNKTVITKKNETEKDMIPTQIVQNEPDKPPSILSYNKTNLKP